MDRDAIMKSLLKGEKREKFLTRVEAKMDEDEEEFNKAVAQRSPSYAYDTIRKSVRSVVDEVFTQDGKSSPELQKANKTKTGTIGFAKKQHARFSICQKEQQRFGQSVQCMVGFCGTTLSGHKNCPTSKKGKKATTQRT